MYYIKVAAGIFFEMLNFLILIRVIMSWVTRGGPSQNPFVAMIYQMTEPILAPFRQLQHKLGIQGMLDFSPIFALITLRLVAGFIMGL